jgi:hypothetical protein
MQRSGFIRTAWVCILILLGPAWGAAQGTGGEGGVSEDFAIRIAEAAATAAFGDARFAEIEPYYDTDNAVSAYAVLMNRTGDDSPLTVIVSARRDDVPVPAMWRGLPRHKDPAILKKSREIVRRERGIAAGELDYVLWLDTFEVYGVYRKIDPRTRESLLLNLYSGRLGTWDDLMQRWANRTQNLAAASSRKTSAAISAAEGKTGAGSKRNLAAYIERKWQEADEIGSVPAPRAPGSGGSILQAPVNYTRYIENVPNINQMHDPPADACGDCGVVAALDVVLYWDSRGYDRLVDGADLATVRDQLRETMNYDCGTIVSEISEGLGEFITSPAYANQYPFDVDLVSDPMFAALQTEIDAGRPAVLAIIEYTDDPNNPSDYNYGNHGVCAVGYYSGSLYPGHSSTEWVIVHDNWYGGDYTNPNAIDNEPYLDWSRSIDYLIRVNPQPAATAVTYPSAGGITWQKSQSQLITWRGFTANAVALDLYRGNSLVRPIAANIPNSVAGGSYNFSVPADIDSSTDYTVRVTGGGQTDFSDESFAILAPDSIHVVIPSAPGIIFATGSTYTITWSSTGNPGSQVRIELFKGPDTNGYIVAENTGAYAWTLSPGQTPGADYWIKISSTSDPAIFDSSDNHFTIAAPVPPSLNLTYPSAPGITLLTGRTINVTWTASATTSALVRFALYKDATLIDESITANDGSYAWTLTTYPLGPGYTIRISDEANPEVFDTSDHPFTVTPTESVHNLTPGDGTIGTQATLEGSGFGSAAGKVYLGGVKAQVLSWGPGSVSFLLKKPPAPGAYDLVLVPKEPQGALAVTLSGSFTIKGPQIESVTPASGTAGQSITISGKFFGTKKGKVIFSDAAGTSANGKVLGWSMDPATNEGTVVVAVPKKLAGPCAVTVTNKIAADSRAGLFTIP